jgi:hypothetical protein
MPVVGYIVAAGPTSEDRAPSARTAGYSRDPRLGWTRNDDAGCELIGVTEPGTGFYETRDEAVKAARHKADQTRMTHVVYALARVPVTIVSCNVTMSEKSVEGQ